MKKAVCVIIVLLLAMPVLRAGVSSRRISSEEPVFANNYLRESRDALLSVGQVLAGDDAVYVADDAPAPAAPVLQNSPAADFPLRRMVALNLMGFKVPVSAVARELAAENAAEEAAAEAEEAEAVAAAALCAAEAEDFLARQAVFAVSLPESVDCSVYALPFDYVCPVSAEISSQFGYRVHPIYGDVRFHYGTDFNVSDGNDIYAFADGTVETAGTISGYGLTLVINHGNGYTSLYGHCSELLAAQGEAVTAGQLVARSGHSGQVTGPHMHFELRRDGDYLNPEFYL